MLANNELAGEKLPDGMTMADLLATIWEARGVRCSKTLAIGGRERKPIRSGSPEFVALEELIDRVTRKLDAQVDTVLKSIESEPKRIQVIRRAKRNSRNAASGQ
jgi:hypothetical protein